MKFITLALLALCLTSASAQSFYDLNTIQDIHVYFGFSDWDTRMDTAKAGSDGYTLADSVVVNGTTFLACGVKFKGNSSYDVNRAKNPLHIKLDYTNNDTYQGYEDIKLGNGWSDNAMIREPLAYSILRQYMDAPQGNFAKVWINGTYYGLMNNAESIDSKFLLDKLYSSSRTFVKCNPASIGAGLGNGSNLGYLGGSITDYETKYELKSDTGWYELIHLCDTLNNDFTAFNSIADIDRFLWMLAYNNVTVNLDSYTGGYRQNYYLYRNHDNQWIPIVWDLNMCFGGFSFAGGTAGAITPANMQTMSYTLHKTETGWPLINKLLNNSTYEKMYMAHMRTINNENFAGAQYKTLANTLHALVDPEVQADPNFLGTYTDFQNSLTTNTNGSNGAGTSPGVYLLMDSRAAYLSNVLSAAPPAISNVNAANAANYGDNATITATVTNTSAVYLGYRYNKADRFTRLAMYDDGTHGDGAAGDNIYGADVVLNSLDIQYYVYAENSNTGAFAPERAEYEFYHINPAIAQAVSGQVVLNEFTANNATGIENESGKRKDWIELYNTTNQALGLGGLYLSDSTALITKWAFADEQMILPGEHLLVWADDKDNTYLDPHTNFNLNNLGDNLILNDGTTIFDSYTFGIQVIDKGEGRCADGAGPFGVVFTRTPRAINDCSNSLINADAAVSSIELYPNPATDRITLDLSLTQSGSLTINLINLTGQVTTVQSGLDITDGNYSASLDVSELASGIYMIQVLINGQSITKRFVKGGRR